MNLTKISLEEYALSEPIAHEGLNRSSKMYSGYFKEKTEIQQKRKFVKKKIYGPAKGPLQNTMTLYPGNATQYST